MDLGSLLDGASGRLLDSYDRDTRRLITILCLPLIDGVFATLLVGGAVATFSDIVMVALTIFTGAGALAVLYSSTNSIEEAQKMVMKAAPVLIIGALIVSVIAPVFEQIFHLHMMQTVAGLALVSIALQMLDVSKASSFPVPAIIVTGAILSLKTPQAFILSLEYVVPGLAVAMISITALYVATFLDSSTLHLDYVNRGGAAVLLLIALSQFGVSVPSNLGLGLFALALFAAYGKGSGFQMQGGVFNNYLKISTVQIDSSRNS